MAVSEAITELDYLNSLDPECLLEWAHARHGDRVGLVTSFQMTGCVMIDMAKRVAPGLRVITIDTLRLPPETSRFIETVEAHYSIGVERFKPNPERLARMIEQHGEHLFFDSRAKQEYCCRIRKVEPNERALATLDVWISGLRRDQSPHRVNVQKATMVRQGDRHLVKLCPLAEWPEARIRAYIDRHNVPCHPLYNHGYASIGCSICTTPTRPGEDKRAGRWRWFNNRDEAHNKECGMHTGGSGI